MSGQECSTVPRKRKQVNRGGSVFNDFSICNQTMAWDGGGKACIGRHANSMLLFITIRLVSSFLEAQMAARLPGLAGPARSDFSRAWDAARDKA
jgi:hypothetical protein